MTWGWQQNRARRRAQPQDRLEPDAHPPHAPGQPLRRAGQQDQRDRCPRSAATSSAAAGTTWSSACASRARRRHRFTWHDRKAWWQQEQAHPRLPDHGRLDSATTRRSASAREAAAFYNAWFFDYDEGAVYFNVLANGIPYLLGTERQKGSHSMAGYHSFELCYLATVYTNLLITKEPMDL